MKKFLVLISCLVILTNDLHAKKAKRRVAQKANVVENVSKVADAPYAVLIDCATGEVLINTNADERSPPSSMTKLMTLYLLFEELAKGSVKLTDEFFVSELAQSQEGSRSFFREGTKAKVEDLVRSIIVHSGNDACVIVAEGLCGDVSVFVDQMNAKAQEFGLHNSHFANPMGLPLDEHYSSVHDLAEIARRLIIDFPQFYHYFSEKTFTINGITQHSRNTLLGNSLGVDGLKTGMTKSGGYGLVASAAHGNVRLIAVVNGCTNNRSRAQHANRLLASGFQEFTTVKVAEAGKPIADVKVNRGRSGVVRVCTHKDISATLRKKYKDSVKVVISVDEPVEAPILIGARLGSLTYSYGDVVSEKHDLFACESVERLGIVEHVIAEIKRIIFGNEASSSATEVKGNKDPVH